MKRRYVFFLLLVAGVILFIYLAGQPYIVNFSRDFCYDYESNSIFGKDSLIDIPPDIVDFVYTKDFVAVKQKPEFLIDIMYDIPEDLRYKNGYDEIYYWLILLKEKKVYGPFLFEEFNMLCEEKNVRFEFQECGTNQKVNPIGRRIGTEYCE